MTSRDEFDDFLDDDEDVPVVDTRADGRLYRVPLGRLSPNLVNPRTDFGTENDLTDFGKSLARRQNQPCPVVSRNAYLKLWPEHADRIGSIDYVLVSGERRYRAATVVGHPSLDCVVNDDFAADHKTFMEAVVSENVDRQNFDAIEEAYAVQALVAAFGTNRAVAQHFERADGWVTQRVLLTHLDPHMQDLVRQKAIPLEHARALGKLARDNTWSRQEQADWWEHKQQQIQAQAEARRQAKRNRPAPTAAAGGGRRASPPSPLPAAQQPSSSGTKRATPVESAQPPHPGGEGTASFTAVKREGPAAAPPEEASTGAAARAEAVPVPRSREVGSPAAPEEPTEAAPPKLPYGDGRFLARHLILKMPEEEFDTMLGLLIEHQMKRTETATA